MQLSIEKHNLETALSRIGNAIDKRGSIPILSNIKLVVEKSGRAIFTATDMDIQIVAGTEVTAKTAGEVTLPGAKLQEITSKIPNGAEINMSLKDNGIMDVMSGKTKYHIKTMSVTEFPKIMDEKFYPHQFSLPADALKKLLNQTKFCISQEETRYYLNGLYLHHINKTLTAVSTDGHRLALSSLPAPKGSEQLQGAIIPKKAVDEIIRLLPDAKDSDKDVMVAISDTKIKVDINGTVISAKLIDGKFPDYGRVIPKDNKNIITINGQMFQKAVDRVAVISSDKTRSVKLTIKQNHLDMLVSSPDHGDAEEQMDIDYKGENLTLSFNCQYLLDLLNATDTEKLKIEALDSFNPILIKNLNDESALYVLLPIRI